MKSMLFALSLVSVAASATNLVGATSLTITPSAELRAYSEKGPVSDQLTAFGSVNGGAASCSLDFVSTKGLSLKLSGQESKMGGAVYSFALTSNLIVKTTSAKSSVEQIKASCNGEPELCSDQLYNQESVVLEGTDANANRVILVCISAATPVGAPMSPLNTTDANITGVSAE